MYYRWRVVLFVAHCVIRFDAELSRVEKKRITFMVKNTTAAADQDYEFELTRDQSWFDSQKQREISEYACLRQPRSNEWFYSNPTRRFTERISHNQKTTQL